MKTTAQYLVVFVFSISFFNCHKDNPIDVLPPITADGLNTIGFSVNGTVWTPFYQCNVSSNPCGKLEVMYDSQRGAPQHSLVLSFGRKIPNKQLSYLLINGLDDHSGMNQYSITTHGEKIDSVHIEYVGDNSSINYVGPFIKGSSLLITKLDFDKKIIAGTFHFILNEYGNINNTIELKDGRFDLKLDVCECH